MKIIPARGYCLIQAEEADEVSAGGVILAERMKDMPSKGKVLEIGEYILEDDKYKVQYNELEITLAEYHKFRNPCKVGDTVIFKRFVDNRIKEEGKELLFVRFEDILGVIE